MPRRAHNIRNIKKANLHVDAVKHTPKKQRTTPQSDIVAGEVAPTTQTANASNPHATTPSSRNNFIGYCMHLYQSTHTWPRLVAYAARELMYLQTTHARAPFLYQTHPHNNA